VTRAWQTALAAEQRAVFGYGLVGAHLNGGPHASTVRSYTRAHQDAQDRCAAELRSRGAVPGSPAPDYPQLYPVADPARAIALAARLEQECAGAWRYLYGAAAQLAPVPDSRATVARTTAQVQLNASAVRGTRWRWVADPAHATVPFPGV
jgi:hypothetical protein